MIDSKRLVPPDEDFAAAFPGLGFTNRFSLRTSGEPLVVCDPNCLADVYNATDRIASLVREHGAFLMDFGGDATCPVWWDPPFVVFPLSQHLSDDDLEPRGTQIWVQRTWTDSGSFVFLPIAETLPVDLMAVIQRALKQGDAAQLPAPAGCWDLLYEQFDAPQKNMTGLSRNIVLKWSEGS